MVITGAAGGIGSALAQRFSAAGARVALLDRDQGGLDRLVLRLGAAGADTIAIPCDVTSLDECSVAVGRVVAAWGGVDVLINNAGITHVSPFVDTDVDVLHRVMDVNFFGAIGMTSVALPSLLERRGQIVVMSSVAGFAPLVLRTGYAASKHALHGCFESLRAELHGTGVGVTLVCPSFVRTRDRRPRARCSWRCADASAYRDGSARRPGRPRRRRARRHGASPPSPPALVHREALVPRLARMAETLRAHDDAPNPARLMAQPPSEVRETAKRTHPKPRMSVS